MRIQITLAALLMLGSVASSEGAVKRSQIARLENATALVTNTGADIRTRAKCIAVIPSAKQAAPVGTTGAEDDSRDTARKEQVRERRQQMESLRRSLKDQDQEPQSR